MTNAAIYVRQSVDRVEGIERQERRCRALVKARGWEAVAVYADNDTSASKARTGGWARMLKDARAGSFTHVVAVDMDRLLRSITDLASLFDLKLKVVTVDGEIDTASADGEFRATMAAGLARFEVRRKSERQKRANEFAATKGKPYWVRRPFGLTLPYNDPKTRQYVPAELEPAEAEAIRWACEQVLLGETLAAITREWNQRGLYTPITSGYGGNPWTTQGVRRVLMHPRIAGLLDFRAKWDRKEGGELLPGQWPAAVSEETWRAVRGVLSNPDRRTVKEAGRYPTRILAGWGTCGAKVKDDDGEWVTCGGTLHTDASRGKPAYRCTTARNMCRQADPAEGWIVEQLMWLLVQGRLSEAADLDSDERTASLRLQRGDLRSKLAEWDDEDRLIEIGPKRAGAAIAKLNADLAQVEDELAQSSNAALVVDLWDVHEQPDAFWERWNALSMARQQSTMRYFFETVTLDPGKNSPVHITLTEIGQRIRDTMLTVEPEPAPEGPGPVLDIRESKNGTMTLRRRLK